MRDIWERSASRSRERWIGFGFLLVVSLLAWIAIELHRARESAEPPLEIEPIGLVQRLPEGVPI